MNKLLVIIGVVVGIFSLVVIMSLIQSIPVYFLWNWLMPTIFNLPNITFLQAIGISLLSNFLFNSQYNNKHEN